MLPSSSVYFSSVRVCSGMSGRLSACKKHQTLAVGSHLHSHYAHNLHSFPRQRTFGNQYLQSNSNEQLSAPTYLYISSPSDNSVDDCWIPVSLWVQSHKTFRLHTVQLSFFNAKWSLPVTKEKKPNGDTTTCRNITLKKQAKNAKNVNLKSVTLERTKVSIWLAEIWRSALQEN